MSTTIARVGGGASTTADFMNGYALESSGRTIVHETIGGGIALTLADASPPTSMFKLFYDDREADARAAHAMLSVAALWTLSDTDRPLIATTFTVVGSGARLELDDETRDHWWVIVEVQVVP